MDIVERKSDGCKQSKHTSPSRSCHRDFVIQPAKNRKLLIGFHRKFYTTTCDSRKLPDTIKEGGFRISRVITSGLTLNAIREWTLQRQFHWGHPELTMAAAERASLLRTPKLRKSRSLAELNYFDDFLFWANSLFTDILAMNSGLLILN
jgi:hypothetical protein